MSDELKAQECAEKLEWIMARGFRSALYDPPPRIGAAQFMRVEWEQPSILALADQNLAFNVAGLYWRSIEQARRTHPNSDGGEA